MLRYAIENFGLSETIDPHFEPFANKRYWEIYEGLTALGPDGSPRPALAETWQRRAPDRLRFVLRSGAAFESGRAVTASDVVASFERARTPRKSFSVAARLDTIATIETLDDRTIDVVTSRPDPLLLARLSDLMIVDASGAADDRPGGSGAYRLASFDPGRLIRLERRDGRARYDEVEVWIIPEADRAAALRDGLVDLIACQPAERAALVDAGFVAVDGPVTAAAGYFLDTVNPDWPTSDRRVRRAINLAVDQARILAEVYGGAGEITPGQFAHAGITGHDPNLRAFGHDPAGARALLAEAGWGGGFEVTIDAVGYYPPDLPKAKRVAEDLAAVGIASRISLIPDLETALQRWYGRTPRGHLSPTSLSQAPAQDAEYALGWFDRDHPTHHYANDAFDAVHRPSQTELDPDRRLNLLQRSARVLHDDPPFLWTVGLRTGYAVRPGLIFQPRSDGSVRPEEIV